MKIKGLTVGNGLTEIEPNTFKIDATPSIGVKVINGTIEWIDRKETINKALEKIERLLIVAGIKCAHARFEEQIGEEDAWLFSRNMLKEIEHILKGKEEKK